MGLDLGSIVRDLGVAALTKQPPMPQYVSYPGQAGVSSGVFGQPAPYFVGTGEGIMGGIPGFDVVGTEGKGNMVYDPNANCGQGKWIKKRRRRHRKLATKGDLQGLAALKGILGNGKAFEVWIATHS